MFNSKNITHTNELLNHIHIFNDAISCKIFPNLGASIQELSLNHTDIIDGIEISQKGIDSFQEYYQSALLFPFVGRVQKGIYQHNSKVHHLANNDPVHINELHGLIFDRSFQITSMMLKDENASVQLEYVQDSQLKGFPFKFKIQITYLISSKGLQVQFNVFNMDTSSFPFGIGWHPYFKTDQLNSDKITFNSVEKLVCDEHMIPYQIEPHIEKVNFEISTKSFDDTFILLENKVKFNSEKYTVQMKFSKNHTGYVQIYTPESRKNIAIEPITCIPDAFNNKVGLMELYPDEFYQWQIELILSTHE